MDDIAGRIVNNRMVAAGYYLLTAELEAAIGQVKPGQFMMLRIPGNEVFLRRPFSIYAYRDREVQIMYKTVGKGTGLLSKAPEGDAVRVLGPLGNGFSVDRERKKILLAGGIGIAGIHLLALNLSAEASVFFGCAGEKECAAVQDLALPETQICTIDGTCGFHGTVVDLLARQIDGEGPDGLQIFACGPTGMFRALKELLVKERPPCQVLVEERMACGLGLCFGCVTKTLDDKEPYKRVCKEGPVFDLWQLSL
jgi:dihydroorotate dehydrogenase electron transfer subunit